MNTNNIYDNSKLMIMRITMTVKIKTLEVTTVIVMMMIISIMMIVIALIEK